jgi:DNA repair protein RadC
METQTSDETNAEPTAEAPTALAASDDERAFEPKTFVAATATQHLPDIELLAMTLGHVSMRRSARLLARFHDLDGIYRAPLDEFEMERMPARRALQLQAAIELGRRSLARPLVRGMPLKTPAAVAQMMGPRLVSHEQEEVHAIGLDAKSCVVVQYMVARGTADEVRVNPRDVFRTALRAGCVAIIVVHNHPSGEADPSQHDRQLTSALAEAGRVVGVTLLDHVIVARNGHFSFRALGILDGEEFGD